MLVIWTIGSLALYVIVSRLIGTGVREWSRASLIGRIAIEVARFVFFIGLPYGALLSGAFAARDIGLQGAPEAATDLIMGWPADDWTRALGQAALLGVISFTAMAVLFWQIHRAAGESARALGITYASWPGVLRDAVYAEAHWSFYRALPMLLIGEAHGAALGGLGLLMVEVVLGGRVSPTPLFEGLLAGLSATFFAVTGGNFWIATGLQCALRLAVRAIIQSPRRIDALADTL